LTGESARVAPDEHVFAGTYVTAGTAETPVTATGMATRFGRIAELTQQTGRERSPLERELDHLTRIVALLAVAIGGLFFVGTTLAGMDLTDRFVFAIGVMVALGPEGLLPTVTLSLALALATQRMARRSALVRRLSSVETLGETTVICTDKTGTLTENQMTAQRLWTPRNELMVEGAGYEPFGGFRAGTTCGPRAARRTATRRPALQRRAAHSRPEGWSVLGDPTEAALVVLAEKAGLRHEQEAARAPRLAGLPFSSERKRMSTVTLVGGERVAYVKGAAEVILPRTTLTEEARRNASAAETAMERDALRVLAPGQRAHRRGGAPAASSSSTETRTSSRVPSSPSSTTASCAAASPSAT
jgi:magnesium-transporting ATPase (P-type)